MRQEKHLHKPNKSRECHSDYKSVIPSEVEDFLHFPYRMPYDRLQFFRGAFSRVAQINLVMTAAFIYVQIIAVRFHIFMHERDGFRLVIVRADMQTLDANALVIGQIFRL